MDDIDKSGDGTVVDGSMPDPRPVEKREGKPQVPIPQSKAAEEIQSVMASFFQGSIGRQHPMATLFSRLDPDHIHKYLDYIQRDDDNAHSLRLKSMYAYAIIAGIAIVAIALLVMYVPPDNRDLLGDVLTFVALLGGGVGIGIGWTRRS